jgi:hypothetical protein
MSAAGSDIRVGVVLTIDGLLESVSDFAAKRLYTVAQGFSPGLAGRAAALKEAAERVYG